MKKIEKLEILKNVGSSWIALGMNVSVGVFLSPYILHRLGDEAFGLWVLIFSVTGYYGLFDLGIRSSIVRYVAKYSARADHNQLNRLVNTAFFAYSAIGIICLLLTFIGTRYVDAWFHVPPNFLATARLLFLMVGISVALGFPLGVFGGILEGLQRFYFLNFSSVLATLTRALFIVIALKHGAQLLTVALITVAMPLGTGLLNAILALRLTPVRFACSNLDRGSLRTIASYSGTTFMIIIAGRLRFKTDAMVIGTMLSAAAITYFAIASRLLDYAAEVVSSLAQIFVPMSSHSDATGDTERLKKILLAGNRACALIIFPISATLLILGKSIIATWVGMKYVPLSYPVLLVLILPQTLMLAQAASGRVLWGMARHRVLAYVVLAEGALNLILSIILVRRYGIVGDALGTAIPLAGTTILFFPQHLCHVLKIRLAVYLRQAYLLPTLLLLPLVAVLLWMRHWYFAHTYLGLGIQLAIASMVYGVGLGWAIWNQSVWAVGELGEATARPEVSVAMVESYQEARSREIMALVKALVRPLVPESMLAEREIVHRLAPAAGRIYLRLRLLDWLGVRGSNWRKLPPGIRSVIFVCFGNIMRSPMAELMLKQALGEHGVDDIAVRSAGIHALNGRQAHPWAQIAARELGLPLDHHQATLLTAEMVAQADAILVMDFQNLAELLARYPQARHRTFMLSAYAEGNQRGREIADPFFGDQDETRRCYSILQLSVQNLAISLVPTRSLRAQELAGSFGSGVSFR